MAGVARAAADDNPTSKWPSNETDLRRHGKQMYTTRRLNMLGLGFTTLEEDAPWRTSTR
jgi:hypothetical protein